MPSENHFELQNKLPLNLESYCLTPDFLPDCSFKTKAIGKSQHYDFPIHQWSEAAFDRPFFYYKKAQTLPSPLKQRRKFLERTSHDWLESKSLSDSAKDYYIWEEANGELIWAYRDNAGKWFKHGLYS